MNAWQRKAARGAVALAVIAGGYLCTRDAYDHTRPPPSAQVTAAGAALPAGQQAPATCLREPAGAITCTEELVVVAPRRAAPPQVADRVPESPPATGRAAGVDVRPTVRITR